MKDVYVSEIMTSQVLFLGPDDDLFTARNLMDENEIHHLPILKEGKIAGIISSNDIAQVEYLSKYIGEKLDESSIFKSLSLHEVMAKDVYFLNSNSKVGEAIYVFSQANFHCLPVVDDGELVGIITAKDMFKHLVVVDS